MKTVSYKDLYDALPVVIQFEDDGAVDSSSAYGNFFIRSDQNETATRQFARLLKMFSRERQASFNIQTNPFVGLLAL